MNKNKPCCKDNIQHGMITTTANLQINASGYSRPYARMEAMPASRGTGIAYEAITIGDKAIGPHVVLKYSAHKREFYTPFYVRSSDELLFFPSQKTGSSCFAINSFLSTSGYNFINAWPGCFINDTGTNVNRNTKEYVRTISLF